MILKYKPIHYVHWLHFIQFVTGKESKYRYVFSFNSALYCPKYLMCHCSNLYSNNYNNNCFFVITTFYKQQHLFVITYNLYHFTTYSAYNLFHNSNTCSLDWYNGDHKNTTVRYTRNTNVNVLLLLVVGFVSYPFIVKQKTN